MKNPIDIVRGRIVDIDKHGIVTIKARYDDWPMLLKREYKECNIQMIDSRPLSDKQRRTCYKLIREISNYTGMGLDPTKEYMKLKFIAEDLQETADQMFSLSNAPMSLVCAFQRFLVRFILDWDIPCSFSLLDFVDDVQDYVYDAIQRDIRINHLALVREARAGEQARLNIDGRDPARTLKGGKVMKKKNAPKNARRADGVLSPEELAKAIEEYKARRAQRLAAKTDEDPTEGTDPVVSAKPTNAPAAAQDDDDTVVAPAGQEPQTVEDKVAAVKDNRDRRDADGDPEDLESAKGVIANQDEDMDILFDIIDTLLAQKEFDEAGCTDPQTDEGDDTTDENNDEGDDDTDNQDSDDDPIPTATPADHTQGEVLNADGIDAIIRQRVKIGMIGKALNLDGVEDMSISAAKKAIIKAVRPEMRLDGKSDAFVNAAFEYAVADVESHSKKDVGYQKKQMFNRDSRTPVSNGVGSADSARQKMIERRQNRAKEEK